MVYKIFLILAIIIEAMVVPVFLKEQRYKKTNKSLAAKMICATMFMVVGILAMKISGNCSEFTKLLLAALTLGWIGDLFLHLRGGAKTYVIGGIAFFAGHLVYAYTYIKLCYRFNPSWNFFIPWRIACLAVLVLSAITVIAVNHKRLNKWFMVPSILYGTMLSVMAICSVSVAIESSAMGNVAFGALLATGSILFTISDILIGFLDYGKVKSFPLKCVNIGTYFAGQTAIAASIAFLLV